MVTNKGIQILSLLKESTKAHHDATELEAQSHKISTGTLSLLEYKKLLLCNWQIHNHLKNAFSFLEGIPISTDKKFVDNSRLQWLEIDLKELGVNVLEVANKPKQAPSYSTSSEVIGGLYVVEGSMLGGQYICRQLRQNTEIKAASSFYFYNGYGKETGKRWAAFRQLAIQNIKTREDIESCVAAAKQTFDFFKSSYQIGMK